MNARSVFVAFMSNDLEHKIHRKKPKKINRKSYSCFEIKFWTEFYCFHKNLKKKFVLNTIQCKKRHSSEWIKQKETNTNWNNSNTAHMNGKYGVDERERKRKRVDDYGGGGGMRCMTRYIQGRRWNFRKIPKETMFVFTWFLKNYIHTKKHLHQ